MQSIDNKYSKVFIVPAEYSSLTKLNDSEKYFDLIYRRLSEWNDLRIDDSAVYYVFDRDPKNNKAGIVKGLMNQLCNSRGDNDVFLNGLLLLSYPCVESFVLEAFEDDFVSAKGSVVKTYIQGNGYSIDAIDENEDEDVRVIRPMYWRTIATSWSMVMGNTSPLDEDGYYHSTEWFFDEFAYALFPGIDWPDLRREDHVLWFAERPEPYVIRRRTFDINGVKILRQWREGEELVVAMNVERDRGDRIVHVHMTPSSLDEHPFAWKIEKGVIQ